MAAIRVRESVVIAVLGTGSIGRGNSRYYSEPFIFLGSSPNYGCNYGLAGSGRLVRW